jgi:hypothetical protein
MADWLPIIYRGYESKELDYKAACEWDEGNKKACCELVKDILALANTRGGWIILGVSEQDSGFSFDGITEKQASTFDTTRLNRFVQNYADPPINALIHKVEDKGRLFVVIEVPQFPNTPHICQKEYPSVLSAPVVYVRTDNKNRSDQLLSTFRSVLKYGATAPEPADSDKFGRQIEESRTRCQQLNPHQKKSYAYRESVFHPVHFSEKKFELSTLKEMAKQASIDFRGWPFIFINDSRPDVTHAIQDGYQTVLADPNPFIGGDDLHFWELRQSGLLFAKELLRTDTLVSVKGGQCFVDFDDLCMSAAEAVHCLVKLYEGFLDDDETIRLRFALCGVQGRRLGSTNTFRLLRGDYECAIPEIAYQEQRPLAEWRAGLVDHAMAICKYVLVRFNWDLPNMGAARDLIEKLLARRM